VVIKFTRGSVLWFMQLWFSTGIMLKFIYRNKSLKCSFCSEESLAISLLGAYVFACPLCVASLKATYFGLNNESEVESL